MIKLSFEGMKRSSVRYFQSFACHGKNKNEGKLVSPESSKKTRKYSKIHFRNFGFAILSERRIFQHRKNRQNILYKLNDSILIIVNYRGFYSILTMLLIPEPPVHINNQTLFKKNHLFFE